MRLRHVVCLTVLTSGVFFTGVEAEVGWMDQFRFVHADAYAETPGEPPDSNEEYLEAPDFTPFDAGAGADASASNTYANVGASLTSEILLNGLTAAGSLGANAETYEFDSFASAIGGSQAQLSFSIDEPTRFSLSGTASAFDSGTGYVRLRTFTGTCIECFFDTDEGTPFDVNGALEPGHYRITGFAGASLLSWGPSIECGSGSFDFSLVLDDVVAVPGSEGVDVAFVAWPNPASDVIHLELPAGPPARGSLFALDVAGRLVRTLEATGSSVDWDLRGDHGRRVAPGVYFMRDAREVGAPLTTRVLVRD